MPEILAAAERTGVPASLIAGIIKVESQGDPDAVSPAGARGLMQVMPDHLHEQGVNSSRWHDPATNIQAGALLLKWKIEATGNQWDGVRHYFGIKCDAFTCTEEYATRVYRWVDHYAPLIAAPYDAGVRVMPAR
ncbi:MAG: transglycosylase SLT domain-containing protein [Chloroflexia bacterium]|nr:transglycosylase SLT domain-containing protein [Chloroflexia bacterium]